MLIVAKFNLHTKTGSLLLVITALGLGEFYSENQKNTLPNSLVSCTTLLMHLGMRLCKGANVIVCVP